MHRRCRWASASLGQVYRARLLTGEEVAVKVQRDDVLRLVAIDAVAVVRGHGFPVIQY